MRTNRIEALSDGIFAIVMTLLILEIRVPELHSDPTHLLQAVFALWPKFLSYLISFVVLGNLWVGHHNQMPYIKKTDRLYLWINIFFFLFVSLIPFSTALLGEYAHERVSIIIYGINAIVCTLILYSHWNYAVKHQLTEGVTEEFHRIVKRRILTGPVIYLLAIILSLLSPKLSFFLLLVPLIYYIFPGQVDRFLKD